MARAAGARERWRRRQAAAPLVEAALAGVAGGLDVALLEIEQRTARQRACELRLVAGSVQICGDGLNVDVDGYLLASARLGPSPSAAQQQLREAGGALATPSRCFQFEVFAQAISEVRTHEHTFRPPSRSRTRSANRDAPRDASPGARHASLSRRQNPEPRDEKRCATRRGAGPGGLGAARPSRETRAGVGAGGRVACFATRASLRGDAARSRRAPSPRTRARPRNQALSGAPARRRNVYPLFSDSEL